LPLSQIGNIVQVFGLQEKENLKLISLLPLKTKILYFEKFPEVYLSAFFLIKRLNLSFVDEETSKILFTIDKFVLQNPKNFIYWFAYQLLKNLGFEPELKRCFKCQRELTKAKEIYFNYRFGLFCLKCRKIAYQKINQRDYLIALKIRNPKKVPSIIPTFVKKIIVFYLVKLKNFL